MTHEEKIAWMKEWCYKNNLTLDLEATCGLFRQCVGVLHACGVFPDYMWYDDDYNRIDNNGEVWVPQDAYHKHPCVAVLGRGVEAEEQLYEWLKWFDENNFVLEENYLDTINMKPIEIIFSYHCQIRLIRNKTL